MISLYGVKMPESSDSKPMSRKEEADIIPRARAGDKRAVRAVLNRNARLVFSVALRYRGLGLDLPDLYQEGLRGLLEALNRFDIDKGYKFMTYAVWYVRQAIGRALQHRGLLVRLPNAYYRQIQAHDKEPERKKKREQLAQIQANLNPLRLDHPHDPRDPVIDLTDPEAGADVRIDDRHRRQALAEILNTLPNLERRIIRARYGWDDDVPRTLQDVADEVGLTRERILQLQRQAEKRIAKRLKEER